MNIKLSKIFKDVEIKTINNKKIKIYSNDLIIGRYKNFVINELLYYIRNEGFSNIISMYSGNIIERIEKIIEVNRIYNNYIKNVIDMFFSKYVDENEIKVIWVVIPSKIYKVLLLQYKYNVFDDMCSIKTNSFRINIYYISKYKGNDVYVGNIMCSNSYYGLYKDYLNLDDRVLCDDNWLTGRLFYGIKSDGYYLKDKIEKLNKKINRIKRK